MARYIDADKFKSNIEKAMENMHLICGVKAVSVGAVLKALDIHPTADVAPKSEVENYKKIAEHQQNLAMDRFFEIKRLEEEIETLKDTNEHLAVMLEEEKQGVIEEYRQRVNIKMGKHTHLLGKEYVQRILREVQKEMEGENNE